jgi:hypothetical protein
MDNPDNPDNPESHFDFNFSPGYLTLVSWILGALVETRLTLYLISKVDYFK